MIPQKLLATFQKFLVLHELRELELHDQDNIDSGTSLSQGLQLLAAKDYRTGAIYDASKDEYLGSFDLRSMMHCMWKQMKNEKKPIKLRKNRVSFTDMNDCASNSMGNDFKLDNDIVVEDVSVANDFEILSEDDSFMDALEVFGRGQHILGVNTKENVKILTQMTLFKTLLKSCEFQKLLQRQNGRILASFNCAIVFTSSDENVQQGFQRMGQHFVSSIAVVNENNILTNALSMTDIYSSMICENKLHLSSGLYVAATPSKYKFNDLKFPSRTNLAVICDSMARQNSHHAWLIDFLSKPEQCISVTDILRHAARCASSLLVESTSSY